MSTLRRIPFALIAALACGMVNDADAAPATFRVWVLHGSEYAPQGWYDKVTRVIKLPQPFRVRIVN